jgi:hypothetical protein
MRGFWRPLALAAAFIVTVVVGSATAQTVIVTKAPPGAAIQLGLNTATVATATADATGLATLTVDLSAHGGKAETDVRIFVDVCDQARRVTLVEAGYQPPLAAPGCSRHEIFGVFYLRNITSLVVNASADAPAVWLRQGPAPLHWLSNEAAGGSAERTGSALVIPNGLVLFGGGGLGKYSTAVSISCGTVTDCAGKALRVAGRVGAEYWFSPYIAASASYLRPLNALTAGSDSGATFTSALAANVAIVTAKVGIPVRKLRLFVEGGANYTWATLTTIETMADQTVTVDGVNQTITGGTETFKFKTKGLGWTIGGGAEWWMKRSLALFTEVGIAKLRGKPVGGGEGTLDDSVFYAVAGFRFHLPGKH